MVFLGACSTPLRWGQHALSSAVRQQIDTTLSLTQLRTTPEAIKTVYEVGWRHFENPQSHREHALSKCCKNRWMPQTDRLIRIGSKSAAWRFARGTLTLRSIGKGRQVTLAGRVLGTRTDTVGEITYVYPLLACLEVYLWPPMPDTRILYPYRLLAALVRSILVATLSLPSLLIDSVVALRTSGGSYAVALTDRAREPTGLRGL